MSETGMDNEQKFWVSIWSIVSITLVGLVLTISSCTISQNGKITDLIKNGTDPIAARCSIVGPSSTEIAMCMTAGKHNGS